MKRILALVTVVFLMTASLPLSAGADAGLSFASIFGDGMVLQQGRPVQVFGFGRDGDTVTVTLKKGDEAVASQTAAVSGGRWNAALPAQSGSFDEYSLEAKAGSVVRTVENLVFGEVWIAGGQSNMEWTLAKAARGGGLGEKGAYRQGAVFRIRRFRQRYAPGRCGRILAHRRQLGRRTALLGHWVHVCVQSQRYAGDSGRDCKHSSGRQPVLYLDRSGHDGGQPGFCRLRHRAGPAQGRRWYLGRSAPLLQFPYPSHEGYQAAGILWYQGETDIERGETGTCCGGGYLCW